MIVDGVAGLIVDSQQATDLLMAHGVAHRVITEGQSPKP